MQHSTWMTIGTDMLYYPDNVSKAKWVRTTLGLSKGSNRHILLMFYFML